MSDLVEFLRQRLDEDERTARAAARTGAHLMSAAACTGGRPEYGEHIARHDPARVLAEVEAKRRILDLSELWGTAQYPDYDGGYSSALDDVVQLLALPYADHLDYREEWRPE